MLGMFTGEFVRRSDIRGGRKTLWMAAAAAALLAAGLAFSGVLPVNKKLWSSTFVCVVGAYSLGMFALFYYLIDGAGLAPLGRSFSASSDSIRLRFIWPSVSWASDVYPTFSSAASHRNALRPWLP